MNWDDLRYLLAVVRGGGLSAAARQQDVSPSTVSRHIERLEQALQQKLFNHGYEPPVILPNYAPARPAWDSQCCLLQSVCAPDCILS